jgi:hypothetical protein
MDLAALTQKIERGKSFKTLSSHAGFEVFKVVMIQVTTQKLLT